MELNIEIKKGLGQLQFGMTQTEVVALAGTPSQKENTENAANEATTIFQYEDEGLTLFFEGEEARLKGEEARLSCIEISNIDSTLFSEEVFDLTEKELINLMVAHGYNEHSIEKEDWGERCIAFAEGNIDFYFDENELLSIIWTA